VLQRARRTKRSFFPWILTLALVATAWFKLVTLSSTLNKMSYQGTWCATNDNLDIKYTFNPASAVSRMPKPLLWLWARIQCALAMLGVESVLEHASAVGRVPLALSAVANSQADLCWHVVICADLCWPMLVSATQAVLCWPVP
jgi:lipoprotein signal peptidase